MIDPTKVHGVGVGLQGSQDQFITMLIFLVVTVSLIWMAVLYFSRRNLDKK